MDVGPDYTTFFPDSILNENKIVIETQNRCNL